MKKTKNKNTRMFFVTFLTAFIIVIFLTTPLLTAVTAFFNVSLSGIRNLVLADEIDFETLIPSDSPFFEAFTDTKRVNVLFLGVNGTLTDTIMLASFDTKNKRGDIIWIPRDTYYYREGASGASLKINSVFKNDPVNTAKAVSETLMNIPINYYAVLRFEGLAEIVDAMGGVPMDIPFHMKYDDPKDKPPLHIDIPEGEQVLDGEHAIQFLRFRKGNDGNPGYPDADLGRISAQQQFIKNAFKKCISFNLPKIAQKTYDNIETDLTAGTLLHLAQKAVGITEDDIETHMMPIKKVEYYVYPDMEEIANLLTEIYSVTTGGEEETGADEL